MKISREQAQKLGIELPPKKKWNNLTLNPQDRDSRSRTLKSMADKKSAAKQERLDREAAFNALCEAHGLPHPDFEFEFAKHLGRKWRFDFLFDGWLAVEKVGGVWTNGHHSRGQDQIDDMEKANHAVLLGYSVLSFTPAQFDSGEAFAFIKKVVDGGPEVQS